MVESNAKYHISQYPTVSAAVKMVVEMEVEAHEQKAYYDEYNKKLFPIVLLEEIEKDLQSVPVERLRADIERGEEESKLSKVTNEFLDAVYEWILANPFGLED